ncbi:hypothetical protein FUAX_10540 [Fulvitalea axinellae]|uniref:DUF5000 domain-containing protein n=1 Tax=Fulvitalea axinellae TaxID=1182444 RepID=A0AAU9CL10_9BACT|nr:hypothetical protein FUAX_10540 [Fulvitalea axinellae]
MNAYKLLLLSCVALCVFSCQDMYEVHEEFVDGKEIVYAPKVDSVLVRPGNGRMELGMMTINSKNVTKMRVTWDNGKKSFEQAVEITDEEQTVSVLLEEMEEKAYNFRVYAIDKEGNVSIETRAFGLVYGEIYRKNITNRSLLEKKFDKDRKMLYLNWFDAPKNSYGVELKYTDATGTQKEISFENDISMSDLPGAVPGSKISYRTKYKPEENAIDFFYTDWKEATLPETYLEEMDKSKFAVHALPTDIAGDAWGGHISKLWNGTVSGGDFYHSSNDEPLPHHFTFDMGALGKLVSCWVDPRKNNNSSNVKVVQFWGIDDITDAATALPSADEGWEAESKAKGWTLLGSATRDSGRNDASFKVNFDPEASRVRYIRVRILENRAGADKYSFMSELTFTAEHPIVMDSPEE